MKLSERWKTFWHKIDVTVCELTAMPRPGEPAGFLIFPPPKSQTLDCSNLCDGVWQILVEEGIPYLIGRQEEKKDCEKDCPAKQDSEK